jgi:hypothetical protein
MLEESNGNGIKPAQCGGVGDFPNSALPSYPCFPTYPCPPQLHFNHAAETTGRKRSVRVKWGRAYLLHIVVDLRHPRLVLGMVLVLRRYLLSMRADEANGKERRSGVANDKVCAARFKNFPASGFKPKTSPHQRQTKVAAEVMGCVRAHAHLISDKDTEVGETSRCKESVLRRDTGAHGVSVQYCFKRGKCAWRL